MAFTKDCRVVATACGRGGAGFLHSKATHELRVSSVWILAWQQPSVAGSDPFPHTNSHPVNYCTRRRRCCCVACSSAALGKEQVVVLQNVMML
jgi:hypothetical protein